MVAKPKYYEVTVCGETVCRTFWRWWAWRRYMKTCLLTKNPSSAYFNQWGTLGLRRKAQSQLHRSWAKARKISGESAPNCRIAGMSIYEIKVDGRVMLKCEDRILALLAWEQYKECIQNPKHPYANSLLEFRRDSEIIYLRRNRPTTRNQMSYNKPRLKFEDTLMNASMKFGEGNPGAIRALMAMMNDGPKHDPDSIWGQLGTLISLDNLDIYGSNIWILYKDVCSYSTLNCEILFRAHQLGFVTEAQVKSARSPEAFDFPALLERIQVTLPRFGRHGK